MVSPRRRGPRGQAMVETVLGIIVFITILMFGIHFAEVGYLSLKVQEASSSALWDSTSAQMHELPGNFSGQSNAISAAGGLATDRYKDFDGRSSKTGATAPVQVYTSADGMTVECKAANDIQFSAQGKTGVVTGIYKNSGGMVCTSKAVLSPTPRLTKSFLDQGEGSLFQVAHLAGGVIPVCGVGRAKGGECKGGFGILLDDWGLAGDKESGECKLTSGSCANQPYFDSAKQAYSKTSPGLSAAYILATTTVGLSPIQPSTFWMSFQGETTFRETEPGGDSDPNDWVTSPGANSPVTEYSDAYRDRERCFLGKKCMR